MKHFRNEIEKIYYRLKVGKNFSLSRFGDGEMTAIRGDIDSPGFGEWITNGEDPRYSLSRKDLYKAFTYKHPDYYVGIVCPCCREMHNHLAIKSQSKQDENNLTFANVFVNSNYQYFLDKIIPLFREKEIHLVAHKKAQVNNLPFGGEMFYPVEDNAWIENRDLIDNLKINNKGKVYLFACGPLGKILAQQLWEHNQNNTYLDIGSTLNPWIQTDINIRKYYLSGTEDSQRTCIWG